MPVRKTIAILGATGNQGGSVVDTLLKAGWHVRAITRSPSSSKAQELAGRGAKVIQADLDSPDTLHTAFEGANVVFAVSDFWGIYGDPANANKPRSGQSLNAWAAEKETQQLKNVIDAVAKISSVEHFILSSLSNATKWSKGKYTHVYHFDSKAFAEEYGREKYPELWAKTSIFQAGLFISNWVNSPILRPKKDGDGVVQFVESVKADVKLPFIAAEEDSGPSVEALIQGGPGKNLIAYREWLTMEEFVQIFTKSTGIPAQLTVLPQGETNLGFLPAELQEELSDNFAYFNEFGYEGRDDPTVVHPSQLQSPPQLGTVGEYLAKQNWTEVFSS